VEEEPFVHPRMTLVLGKRRANALCHCDRRDIKLFPKQASARVLGLGQRVSARRENRINHRGVILKRSLVNSFEWYA